MIDLSFLRHFFQQLYSKDLYCWGNGKYYRNHTLPFLQESGLIDNVKGFVDHRSQFEGIKKENAVILISVSGYKEIMTQIRAKAECSAIPSTFAEALFEDMRMLMAPKAPVNYRKNPSERIPRMIHTFWFSEHPEDLANHLPKRYEKCLESWKKYAPDFEIKIWNQNNYHAINCPFYDQAIEEKCWAFASDYARADVLRRYGGIYMDLDVELLRPIDDLLYNDAYMSFESLTRIECGSGMGACAGNQILDEICSDYENRPFRKEDGTLDLSTCPVRYTKIIEKHGLIKNGGFQRVEDITIYPFDVLTGKSFDTGIIYSSESSYSLHHHNGSWVPEHTQNAMDRRYEDINDFLYTFIRV